MFFDQLLKFHHAVSVSSDDEVHVGVGRKDLRNNWDEKVDSFAVLETRDKHNVDSVWVSTLLKFLFSDGIVWSKAV